MFDTVESSSSSLDRGVMNWTSVLNRQIRQTSADRIQTQQPIDQKPLMPSGGGEIKRPIAKISNKLE